MLSRRRVSALLVLSVLCLLLLAVSLAPTRASAAVGKKKKLTEAQLAEIEDQWMEDEEETEGQFATAQLRTTSDCLACVHIQAGCCCCCCLDRSPRTASRIC